jgi:hypothetical protein
MSQKTNSYGIKFRAKGVSDGIELAARSLKLQALTKADIPVPIAKFFYFSCISPIPG